MGVSAPEQVKTVHWTRFPAAALDDVDWADHHAAHRAVMRLFPPALNGHRDQRRASSMILYRVDLVAAEAVVLVQSAIAPQLLPPQARTLRLSEQAWVFEPGDRIAFRVAVNPVRRRTVRSAPAPVAGQRRDRTADKDRVVGAVTVDEMPGWLTGKLGDAVTDLEVVNHYRDETIHGRHKVIVDTLDCIATVANAETLDRLRRHGVGRAKSYGCGLLTARPAVD
jgi:CRISPR system Cascade subunit CasE